MERFGPDEASGDLYVWLHAGRVLVVRDEKEKLSLLRCLVDGHVEHVNAHPSMTSQVGFVFDLWVNEEFLYREDWEVNHIASHLAGQVVVGPAVISLVDSAGETRGLTLPQVDALAEVGVFTDAREVAICSSVEVGRILRASSN